MVERLRRKQWTDQKAPLKSVWAASKWVLTQSAGWIQAVDLCWGMLECWVPPPHSTEQYSKWTFVLTFILWLCFSLPWAISYGSRKASVLAKAIGLDWIWGSPAGSSFGTRTKTLALHGMTAAPRPHWALASWHTWPVQKHGCTNITAPRLYCRGNLLHALAKFHQNMSFLMAGLTEAHI